MSGRVGRAGAPRCVARWWSIAAKLASIAAIATVPSGCAMDNPLFDRGDPPGAHGSGGGDDDDGAGSADADGGGADGDGGADKGEDAGPDDDDDPGGDDDDGDDDNGDDDDDDDATGGDDVDATAGVDAGDEAGTGDDDDDDDDAGTSGGAVDGPERPEAVYVFGGGQFTGRIEFDDLVGIPAAEAACLAALETDYGGLPCAGDLVPLLREGPSSGEHPSLAEFLGVVDETPVRAPTNIQLAQASDFFEGPHPVNMVAAGVFAEPAGISHLWLGFDDALGAPNCNDWTTAAGADGVVGDAGGGWLWYATGVWSCQIQNPILCACW